MSVVAKVREFIVENFLMGDDDGFNTEDSLLDTGVIDSTGVLELVMFIEDNFSFEVEDSDVVPENFDTVDALAAYITSKEEQGASQ